MPYGIFDAIIAKEFSDYRYARVHRLTVDAYALQHPDPYMVSTKSFAAHLTGIRCAMEYENDPNLLRILQQWLNGKKQPEKPKLLENVGSLTISHVVNAGDGKEHAKWVNEWAENVWNAYAIYYNLAREWIETAKQDSITKP